jgi:hypothetical protein
MQAQHAQAVAPPHRDPAAPANEDALAPVDTERYPVHRPDSPALQAAIRAARDGLAQDGCARIPQFIRPDWHAALARETDRLAPQAQYSTQAYTPYGTPADDSFPPEHPRRRAHRTTSGNVTRDLIPEDTRIQQLYHAAAFKAFVAACLEAEELYEFADPMRGLTINVMPDGTSLGWHFDANEFVVSLMTRRPEQGGTFEYCPGLRAPGQENYEAVQAVLDGARDRVKPLDLQVGDLQIFKGRYSLHRVAPLNGERHTVIFGYAREPGYIGSVESTRRVYGRVTQAHIDAEHQRHRDGLTD